MAKAVSRAIVGALTDVQTTQSNPLGAHVLDESGNEYVYCKGVASLGANDMVTIDKNTWAVTRLVSGANGPVGIAQSAFSAATSFGWVLVDGVGAANQVDGTSHQAGDLVLANVAGKIASKNTSGGSAAGDVIYGARARSTTSGSTAGTVVLELSRAFIYGAVDPTGSTT